MSIKRIVQFSAIISFAVVLAACSHTKAPAAEKTNTNANTPAADSPKETVPEAERGNNSVMAEDQQVKDGNVTIKEVNSKGAGWIVIHADNSGVPGSVVGQSFVPAGKSSNITVLLDITKFTPKLYAMLHTDAPESGKYEFPGADAPVKEGEKIVMDDFNATLPSGEMKKEEKVMEKPQVKEFSLTAKKWEFTPSTIAVNKGDSVKLTIKSTDVDHGFLLPEFGINKKLKAGETTIVEFVADKTGTFSFSCNNPCGDGHGDMKGTLKVQ